MFDDSCCIGMRICVRIGMRFAVHDLRIRMRLLTKKLLTQRLYFMRLRMFGNGSCIGIGLCMTFAARLCMRVLPK